MDLVLLSQARRKRLFVLPPALDYVQNIFSVTRDLCAVNGISCVAFSPSFAPPPDANAIPFPGHTVNEVRPRTVTQKQPVLIMTKNEQQAFINNVVHRAH